MTIAKELGGSAFPHHDVHGMTMRDYFAAAALASSYTASGSTSETARLAYQLADAMIRRREE